MKKSRNTSELRELLELVRSAGWPQQVSRSGLYRVRIPGTSPEGGYNSAS